ncbi:peptidoglycan-binding protein [Anaerotaenia torta]|uniref:peptidoglycan-binding protein n=1 Tax=Anaerotaenia torta TaxID=433293 RepID=UPI003D212955
METQALGQLRIRCTTDGVAPVPGATVSITAPNNPTQVIEQLTTDESGLTPDVPLPAPPIDLSLEPSEIQPYSEYDLRITAPNLESAFFSGVQILADQRAEQNVEMLSPATDSSHSTYVILPHTLYYEYPPKIPEAEVKPTDESGEIVLSRVVVPEFVVVHDGPPASQATNHYVRFRDYIKNVASSEIYATWPEQTIYANVLAILSFTMNRVYTEWYRNQGYNFTITSSTAYDHKWINGRNIFNNIGLVVDSIFTNYLSRPGITQPILTQYCDGNRVSCPGWMTQWGSKSLGDQNYSAIEILRHFYGDSMYINTAVEVSGVPVSWPGSDLTLGADGDAVRTIQNQLNRISDVYTAIPKVAVDGNFGPQTAEAVRTFQGIFDLPVTGVVDQRTWYRISNIYVGVTRIGQ